MKCFLSSRNQERAYKLAANDYMLDGGYKALKGGKVIVDPRGAKLMANDVMALVKKLGTVEAKDCDSVVTQFHCSCWKELQLPSDSRF